MVMITADASKGEDTNNDLRLESGVPTKTEDQLVSVDMINVA